MLLKLKYYINYFLPANLYDINAIHGIIYYIKTETFLYDLDLTKPFVIHLLDLKGNIIYYSTCTLSEPLITGISCYTTLYNIYPDLCNKLELALKNDKYNLFDGNSTSVIIYISEKYTPELNVIDLVSRSNAAVKELDKLYNDLDMQESLK